MSGYGFRIVTPPAVEPITVDWVKARLRIDGSELDDEIAGLITAAREEAEHLLERSLARQTLQMLFDAWPGDIPLRNGPLVSVVSIAYADGNGDTQTLDSADYVVDTSRSVPWVLCASDADWPITADVANAVVVTYEAGHTPDDCPQLVKKFLCARVGAMLRDQESDAERPSLPNAHIYRLIDRYRIVWPEF